MTSTSTARDKITYGFYIRPENYCRIIQNVLQEGLLLIPGTEYYLPWDRESITIMKEVPNVTERNPSIQEAQPEGLELFNWLKLAESAFKFWDNEEDDEWNNL